MPAQVPDVPHARLCQWLIGDPSSPEASFCGSETNNGQFYCDYHTLEASRTRPALPDDAPVNWTRLGRELLQLRPVQGDREASRDGVSWSDLVHDVILELQKRQSHGEELPENHGGMRLLAELRLTALWKNAEKRGKRRERLEERAGWNAGGSCSEQMLDQIYHRQLAEILYDALKKNKDARRLLRVLLEHSEIDFKDNRRLADLLSATTLRIAKLKQQIKEVASNILSIIEPS